MSIPEPFITDTKPDRDVTGQGSAVLLRVEDAAALLRIGRSTAYGLIRSGQLASVKIGGSRRVPRVAVDAFVEQLQR